MDKRIISKTTKSCVDTFLSSLPQRGYEKISHTLPSATARAERFDYVNGRNKVTLIYDEGASSLTIMGSPDTVDELNALYVMCVRLNPAMHTVRSTAQDHPEETRPTVSNRTPQVVNQNNSNRTPQVANQNKSVITRNTSLRSEPITPVTPTGVRRKVRAIEQPTMLDSEPTYLNGFSVKYVSREALGTLFSTCKSLNIKVTPGRKEFDDTVQAVENYNLSFGTNDSDRMILRYALNKQTLQLQGKDTPLFKALQLIVMARGDYLSAARKALHLKDADTPKQGEASKNSEPTAKTFPSKSDKPIAKSNPVKAELAFDDDIVGMTLTKHAENHTPDYDIEQIPVIIDEEAKESFEPIADELNLMQGVMPRFKSAPEEILPEPINKQVEYSNKKVNNVRPKKEDIKKPIESKSKPAAATKRKKDEFKKLRKLIPTAMEFLSEQSVIDLNIGLTEFERAELTLSDYSVLLVPPYRGLERFIFDLQDAKNITVKMIGQAFDKDDNGNYVLKSGYCSKINSVIYAEVMAALYSEYFARRNFFAHSDNSLDGASRMINDKIAANKVFHNLLKVIEYNSKKLKEIDFKMIER